ncbi:UNVERIFIED_CONTAM: hypothetical protein PYX00_001122 [Menopon gallinae]|uniref:Uncharacterized protein n=1 Tax=Menopon gallinae TaxID=328185 RepID=A0AAW2IBP9_9NEOP
MRGSVPYLITTEDGGPADQKTEIAVGRTHSEKNRQEMDYGSHSMVTHRYKETKRKTLQKMGRRPKETSRNNQLDEDRYRQRDVDNRRRKFHKEGYTDKTDKPGKNTHTHCAWV